MLRTHFVYTALDAGGRALYVGCTKDPGTRYRHHMAGLGHARGWFQDYVVRWRVSGPYPKATALAMERRLIADLQPVYNGMSKGNMAGLFWQRPLVDAYVAAKAVA